MNFTRRGFLGSVTTGMAGIGLVDLLARHATADQAVNHSLSSEQTPWRPGVAMTHHPAKAKRVLQIFCPGAASHMDLWEHKPALAEWAGKPLPGEENFRLSKARMAT